MEMQADFLHVFFAGHVMCIALFAEMHEKYQQLPNRLVHFKQSFHFAAPHDDRSTMIFSVSLSPERSQIRQIYDPFQASREVWKKRVVHFMCPAGKET